MAVLNMANASKPGGGYRSGAGAQEENLHRRTDLWRFLHRSFYPLKQGTALVSKDVTVFRGVESEGYPFLEEPFQIDVISCAATCHPKLRRGPFRRWQLVPHEYAVMKAKAEAILTAAQHAGSEALVLCAFGGGVLGNPPADVANIFRDLIAQPFRGGGLQAYQLQHPWG